MTDFICHSSLPCVVLEKVADFYWSLYLSAQKRRPCVYISTPLRYQQKVVRLVLDPWFKSSYEPLRKLTLILVHVRTTNAQISLRDWSAPLFFAVARFVFFFFEGEASHKLKWKAKWFSGMYKFLIESVITGLFSRLIHVRYVLICWFEFFVNTSTHVGHFGRVKRKRVFRHMRIAKAQISLRIRAVLSEFSLSANRIAELYRMNQFGTNASMILCACAEWSIRTFPPVWRHWSLNVASPGERKGIEELVEVRKEWNSPRIYAQLSMKFLLLIVSNIANIFLLNTAEHKIFSAYKYENTN